MSKEVEKKKFSDFDRYDENPFLGNIRNEIEPVQRMKWTGSSNREIQHTVYNDTTGEIIGHSAFMQMVEVDEKKFAKIYLSQVAAFWELSKPAIRVFTYIMTILKPDKDKFHFINEECLEHTGYSTQKPIFEGLADLLSHGIIARGKYQGQYYINPMIIFNGNRITFAKTYVRKQMKKAATEHGLQLTLDLDKMSYKRLQDEVIKLEGNLISSRNQAEKESDI